ncbi:hypothetical protein DPF_1234 [Desulfoplanes formicivorans]|uniref:Uncharacterized protein n=2 Tax=Desulfoplanes formicivorans TaxID=1592317 RepID=A0A194AIE0_9BACT|nr:hypothetical protein DPF_1234 [Desulfoplanes formicivorans]
MSGADLVFILGAGVLNDCAALAILFMPLVLYLTFLPDTLARTRGQRIGFALFVFCSLYCLLFLVEVEGLFFHTYNARFNHVAVRYLLAPGDLLTSAWKSYPLIWIIFTDMLLAALIFVKIWPSLDQAFEHPAGYTCRLAVLAVYGLFLVPVLWTFTTSYTISDNNMVNELARNDISSLLRAFHSRHQDNTPKDRSAHQAPQKTGTRQPDMLQQSAPPTGMKLSPHSQNHLVHDCTPKREEDTRPIMEKMALLLLLYKGCL